MLRRMPKAISCLPMYRIWGILIWSCDTHEETCIAYVTFSAPMGLWDFFLHSDQGLVRIWFRTRALMTAKGTCYPLALPSNRGCYHIVRIRVMGLLSASVFMNRESVTKGRCVWTDWGFLLKGYTFPRFRGFLVSLGQRKFANWQCLDRNLSLSSRKTDHRRTISWMGDNCLDRQRYDVIIGQRSSMALTHLWACLNDYARCLWHQGYRNTTTYGTATSDIIPRIIAPCIRLWEARKDSRERLGSELLLYIPNIINCRTPARWLRFNRVELFLSLLYLRLSAKLKVIGQKWRQSNRQL